MCCVNGMGAKYKPIVLRLATKLRNPRPPIRRSKMQTSLISATTLRLIVLLAVSLSVATVAKSREAGDDSRPELRIMHEQGDPATPISMVFRSFLGSVHRQLDVSEADGIHYIMDVFEIPHTPEGRESASAVTVIFKAANKNLRNEEKQAEISLLCPKSRSTRSKAQIYRAMDAIDDVTESIAVKHYELTMNALDLDMFDMTSNYLWDLRNGFVYWKEDHQVTYENRGADADVHERVERRCEKLMANQWTDSY